MDASSNVPFAPLSDGDDPMNAASSSRPSSSFAIPFTPDQPCPLLHLLPPLRSVLLQSMDDLTAIRYLSTCRSLHASYHHYPLKRDMSENIFRHSATDLDTDSDTRYSYSRIVCALVTAFIVFAIVVVPLVYAAGMGWVVLTLLGAVGVSLVCCIPRIYMMRRRTTCCSPSGWGMRRRPSHIPRVTELTAELGDVRLLPFLQHLTSLSIAYDKRRPFGGRYPLPRSVHTLLLFDSRDLFLTPHTLPPRLTTLSVGRLGSNTLPASMLPPSLQLLRLRHDVDVKQPQLLVNLQRLDVCRWTLPLSNAQCAASLVELHIRSLDDHALPALPAHLRVLCIGEVLESALPLSNTTLPASLAELHILRMLDQPLPALPSQLEVLCVGGAFNRSVASVPPASLRVLRLQGDFDQPLTAELFASTPWLEELHLGSRGTTRPLLASALPRSLRVLRLGAQHSIDMAEASHVPPRLRRVILSFNCDAERVRRFERWGQAHLFVVVHASATAVPAHCRVCSSIQHY